MAVQVLAEPRVQALLPEVELELVVRQVQQPVVEQGLSGPRVRQPVVERVPAVVASLMESERDTLLEECYPEVADLQVQRVELEGPVQQDHHLAIGVVALLHPFASWQLL